MPIVARTYAIPQELAAKHKIERYGFHGMAHEDLLVETLRMMDRKSARGLRVITCQLGNGVSLCAIKDGKSVDTTMGFTPLEGLVMGTRSGSVDPAIVDFLCEHEGISAHEAVSLLEQQSGLLALGGANDVRELLQRERVGSKDAKLALDVFAYHVRRQIGAYVAVLGGLDVLVLGGGIPRAPAMRERICHGMGQFGIELGKGGARRKAPAEIGGGNVRIFVVEPDEQARMFALARKF